MSDINDIESIRENFEEGYHTISATQSGGEIVARIGDSGYRAAERILSAFYDVFDRCKVEHEEVES